MISFDKFAKIFILMSITLLVFIAGFNYYIDPAGIFNNKKVDIAVDYLKEGYSVAGLTNFDERIFKKKFILQSEIKPETIVFGSIRAMGIYSDFEKEQNEFANYSVSAANFNDDIALFYIYVNKYNNVPNKIVLAVEPWDLNKNHGDTRWESLKKEYYDGLTLIDFANKEIKEYSNFNYMFEKIKTLFSISYLRNSIKIFKNGDAMPYIADGKYVDTDLIRPDGSREYGDITNSIKLEEVNKIAKSYINTKNISQLENFNALDENEINKFEAFIKYLKLKNVEIILYFPPYHPIVYEYFKNNKKYNNVIEAEKYFIKFAEKEELKIIGSYDPKVCNVTEIDFSDGRHLRTSGYEKVFKDKF